MPQITFPNEVYNPYNLEAERALLGGIIQDNMKYNDARNIIKQNIFFYKTGHKILWDLIGQLLKKNEEVTAISLIHNMSKKQSDTVGGAYYITGLNEAVVSPENTIYNSKIISDEYYKRQILLTTKKLQQMSDNREQLDSIIAEIGAYSSIINEIDYGKLESLTDVAEETLFDIFDENNKIHWGFESLDKLAGGMTRGEVSVIAGRPGHGKTTFVLNLIPNLIEEGLRVVMVNREMTNTEMMKKLFVREGQDIMYKHIRSGKKQNPEQLKEKLNKVKETVLKKYENKLFMIDNAKDLASSITKIRKIKPDVVIDDYIQLIKIPGGKDRRFEIEDIMSEYKWLAKTSNPKLSVIAVSQLNREVEKRPDGVPRLSDLSEGGTIEQVAENVFFIYYEYKVKYNYSKIGKYALQIFASKVRYGETGQVLLGFNGNRCRIYNSQDDVVISR